MELVAAIKVEKSRPCTHRHASSTEVAIHGFTNLLADSVLL